MGVAQEEVPHRISTNYVGKLATEADKLLGKADEAFDNEDYDTAFKYYQKAAEAGNIDAYTGLGRCYAYGLGVVFNAQNALHWYQKAAYAGSALGQYYLGILYFEGWNGEKPDKKKGLEWLFKAANGCEPWAMFYIGNCYKRGDGVEKNIDEAIRWYKKAAEYGDEDAPLLLKELGAEMPENTE
jgi:sel1 repeat protein